MNDHIDDNSSPENWAKWLKDVDLDLEEETFPEIIASPAPEEPEETFAEIEIPIEEEAPMPEHEELHGGQKEEEWEREEREEREYAAVVAETLKQNAAASRAKTIKTGIWILIITLAIIFIGILCNTLFPGPSGQYWPYPDDVRQKFHEEYLKSQNRN
jgi:hypothetical protein